VAIKVRIKGLVVDPISKMPIVVLQDPATDRLLPIWIGVFEANAITLKIENITTPRPMTHDLLSNLLEHLSITVERVTINDIRNNTFYAVINCRRRDEDILVDARPSDAIALALRTDAPIFVEEDVIARAHSLTLDPSLDNPENLCKWLETLQPEDFGKYRM
jgi:bifunctional DNase/RNase